ncbi:MAG TPA: S46 family peptidase [Gemmatimonadales bacterium]|nr:S46 family peptidase [Gemmatimonadales bacterium]
MHCQRSMAVLVALFGLVTIPASLTAQQPPAAGTEYPGLETGTMWTFDVPPLDYWAKRYNFRPSTAWLDHVRLSAARIPGCSASFVSPDGLVMTNHHCARACIDAVTKPGEDLLANGFTAATRAEERPCPGMVLDQLQAISDVTDSVNAAVPGDAPASRAARLRSEAIAGIERRCNASAPDANCQVVTMYRGGQYKLYRFRRFNDLRLVFAVEAQTAFFGGDPDNFTYPRYDLDVSMVRAYVDSQPAHTEYLRWSTRGASEGDLVFEVGNPGSTGRLNTVAQLQYLRDVQYPATLKLLADQIRVYQTLADADSNRANALRNTLFGLQNSQKAIRGYQSGLLDPEVMARKREWERAFQAKVDADPVRHRLYGDAWDRTAAVRRQLATLDVRRRYHAFGAYGSRLLGLAGMLVRMPAESAKPDSARLAMFRDANRSRLERVLYSPQPVDTTVEAQLLAAYFGAMQKELPATDPVLVAALGGRSPEQAAHHMVAATSLGSAEGRRALAQGGSAALAASRDPFIALARVIDPLERRMQRQLDSLLDLESRNDERVARALLAVFGSSVAPDATFSLRISDGTVLRYPMNGTFAPAFTTLYGLYDRAAGFGGKEPWNLTPRWQAARDSLDLATPLNGVCTCDIIGGNSGSPVVDRDGAVVGLIFDENMEALPNRFLFRESAARSVWVDVRGLREALRRVYGAAALADELTGR